MPIAEKIIQRFEALHGENAAITSRSPGRVNIIGEHTDYNEGFVLPAAIDKAIFVSAGKRDDDLIDLYSEEFSEKFNVHISDIRPTKNWATYILGVVSELKVRGHKIGGFNMVVDGDIPIGAGLSSSAAVECAVVFALNELFQLGIEKLEMVKIAQKAEHNFSGVMCGIMDMFASVMGKKDHVIRLDCRSLDFEYEPFQLDGYKILLLNTNVKHSLASSAYNTRRQECEQGVSWIKEHHSFVNSLRDTSMQMLDTHVLPKDKTVYQRCSFVVQEIDRLLKACGDLENGDIHSMGKRMFETHDGLSKLYEVSCTEADFLVDAVRNNPAVAGARMMGGGFGGCTINIIKENAIDELVHELSTKYETEMGKELTHYISTIEDGTSVVNRR